MLHGDLPYKIKLIFGKEITMKFLMDEKARDFEFYLPYLKHQTVAALRLKALS